MQTGRLQRCAVRAYPPKSGRAAARGKILLLAGMALCFVSRACGPWPAAGQSSSADSARAETPGPCSRRTSLVISELMYHPRDRADSNNLEFVEMFNSQLWPEDVSGFQLAGAVQFTFPTGTVLAAEGV